LREEIEKLDFRNTNVDLDLLKSGFGVLARSGCGSWLSIQIEEKREEETSLFQIKIESQRFFGKFCFQ
jgi:hypothetical protein